MALAMSAVHCTAPANVVSAALTENTPVVSVVVAAVMLAVVQLMVAGPALLILKVVVAVTVTPEESIVIWPVGVLTSTEGGVVLSFTDTAPPGPAERVMLLEPDVSSRVTVCWVDLISIFLPGALSSSVMVWPPSDL